MTGCLKGARRLLIIIERKYLTKFTEYAIIQMTGCLNVKGGLLIIIERKYLTKLAKYAILFIV